MLRTYKQNAKDNHREWGLTDSQFDVLIANPCLYCGLTKDETSTRYRKTKRKWIGFNGIDRVDSSLGYVGGNVVSCCSLCNFMKGAMDLDDFLSHIRRLFSHLPELDDAVQLKIPMHS
jgi:hypothetical protein